MRVDVDTRYLILEANIQDTLSFGKHICTKHSSQTILVFFKHCSSLFLMKNTGRLPVDLTGGGRLQRTSPFNLLWNVRAETQCCRELDLFL